MAKRCELSDEAWTVVVDLFTEGHRKGRPRLSDRLEHGYRDKLKQQWRIYA